MTTRFASAVFFGIGSVLAWAEPVPAPAVAPAVIIGAESKTPEPTVKKAASGLRWLSSKEAADSLSETDLKAFVDLLRQNSTQTELLKEDQVARASIQGLLDRLGSGARIATAQETSADETSPFHHEIIEKDIGYIRLGTLSGASIAQLDKSLDEILAKTPGAIILDLRATTPDTNFELAAEICRRFAPKGRVLFSIKRPKVSDEEIITTRVEPRWTGVTVLLVDSDTSGSGEVIAAVLRTHAGAYVIGQQTQGEAAQFKDLPMADNKILRVAIGEVSLPDSSPVFPDGLKPDLTLAIPQEQTNDLLKQELEKGMSLFVTERERPKLNEAALVAGKNPEFDAMQEQQKAKALGGVPKTISDIALQRALDFITSVRVFEAKKK